MIPKTWAIKCYLLFSITIGLALQSKGLNHNDGLQSNSKGSTKLRKDPSLRDFKPPPKKFVKTINDQLRQVINKLPSGVHRRTTTQGSPNLFKRRLNGNGRSSEIVPDSGMIVEVFDEGGVDNDVLKRDEISRPEVTQGVSGVRHDNVEIRQAFATSVAQWGQWSIWSACSATCDDGKRTRTRTCGSDLTEDTCPGSSLQAESCLIRHCPVDGSYTDWTSWSSCSGTCGQQSIQMRMRICMSPRPQYGGKDCPGSRFKIRHCAIHPCQDESATVETSNHSEDKNKDLDDSGELLDSLKTVLQLKTSSLEEKLSGEPTGSASKLFDNIYQGSGDIASSGKSENASKTDASLTEFLSNGKQNEDNAGSENILQKADKIDSKISTSDTPNILSDRNTNELTDTKLDQTLLNKNTSSPIADKGLGKSENLIPNEKVGTLSVHLKNTNDTADLERLSDLIGNLDNAGSGVSDETSNLSTERPENMKIPVKTGQADILGKINVDGSLVESSLREGHAWESGGLDRKDEVKNASVLSPGNNSTVTKFDSIFVDNDGGDVMETSNNETTANEIYTQNSILNAPSSEFATSETSETKKPNAHTLNSIISKEGKLLNSGHEPLEELNNQILNASISKLKKVASSKKPGTEREGDHVQGMFPKHAAKDETRDKAVDDHVRLRTASVSVTDNGTSVFSILGVIRYDEDGKSPATKFSGDKTTDNITIHIHDNGEWSSWASCSSSCGRGYQTRSKKICLQLPASREYDCSHVKIQKKSCGETRCPDIPIEPQIHPVKVQKLQSDEVQRLVNHDKISLAGRISQVENSTTALPKHETEIMGLVRQELDTDFFPWSSWSVCSLTCGPGGIRTRTRKCQGRNKPNCVGAAHESETCFVKHCPVNGEWSIWSHWTPCSQSCGKSVKLRMRKCDNPAPLYGGEKCNGDAEEQMKCDVPACSVHGHWSLWSPWSNCPVTCGQALRKRTRSCNNPPPSNGGLTCEGESTEHLNCHLPSCPIDGGFSHWQSWSACHKSCGESSFRTRFRFCNNPPPSDGGKTCHGDRLQVSKCPIKPCTEPVNGGFSQWSNWSSCSLDCQPGSVTQRTRMCDNPKPLYGGLDCAGDDTDYKNCSVDECRVDGGLSDWTAWSACSQSCGDTAIKSRERTCTKPPPSGGGKNCSGETFEIKLCEKKPCHQVITIPTPVAKNEKTDTPLVQTIIDEKEQLLTEKKNGNNVLFSDLKKKLIENLKKLAPDLGLSLGNGNASTSKGSTPEQAKEVKNVSEHVVGPTRAVTEVRYDTTGGARRKLGRKGNLGDIKEHLRDPDDQSRDDSVEETINPIKSCGFNPCRLAKCLSDPFADCIPNTDCDPVYYDSSGNVRKDCNVEMTFLTVPANQLCEQDPCQMSMCLKLPMTKCLTSALCKPVYFDENGNVLNCTGVLKTPVTLTCGRDPCVGKLCPVDAQARCFTDYQCKSTFWNLDNKEEITECQDPDLGPAEDGQVNADDRSQTPVPHNNSPSKKTLHRPWLRLSKSALNEILKHSRSNDIFIAHAKLKHLRGKNRLSSGQSGLTMTLHEHNDDDLTSTSDDDTNNSDENDNHNNEIPFTFSKTKKPQFSLSGVPSNKLKQYNNPRKNPILTLTSLDANQYQSQGGNGVSVTKDWKLKFKPPIHLDGYVESPQVYKVNTLTHDRDQNAEEYLLHHRKNGLLSEDLSSQRLNAEGLNAEGLNAEGLNPEGLNSQRLTSEGKISDRLTSGRLSTAGLSPGRLALEGLSSDEGLNPERLASDGLHSDYHDLHGGNMRFTSAPSALNSIDRLLKSDEAHVVGDDIDIAHALTPNPYDKVLKQDISDLESALSNAEGHIPGEDRLLELGSPVIRQGLTASLRSPDVEKESQINLAELEAPRGIVPRGGIIPRVGNPRAIPPEVPADDLSDSQGGRYVPLDSVIDDLRVHIGENPLNNNLGFP